MTPVEIVLNQAKDSFRNSALTRPDLVKDQTRDPHPLWLNKNENIDPILNEKVFGLLQKLNPKVLYTYPETAKIYAKLSALETLPAQSFLLTQGSDGAIRTVFDLFVRPGDQVVHSSPTFAMYDVYCKMYGATQRPFEYQTTLEGPKLEFEKFVKLIQTSKPRLVCLPNPDSPTGTVLKPAEISTLVEVTKQVGSVLLIDEAYYPFYAESVIQRVLEYPHLLVARSFSKAWGAAGLRVGFLAGHPEVMSLIQKNRPMYELGSLSVELLSDLLDHREWVLESVQRLLSGKEFFIQEMKKLQFQTLETHGNFFHVNFAAHDEAISKALAQVVLYRREFGGTKCLGGYSRFSLAVQPQFEQIVKTIRSAIL